MVLLFISWACDACDGHAPPPDADNDSPILLKWADSHAGPPMRHVLFANGLDFERWFDESETKKSKHAISWYVPVHLNKRAPRWQTVTLKDARTTSGDRCRISYAYVLPSDWEVFSSEPWPGEGKS